MLFLVSDSIISLIIMFILMEMSILYLITLYKNKNDKKFRWSIIISIIFVIIIGICGYVVYNEENSIEIGDNKHKNTFIVDLSEVDMNKPLPEIESSNFQKLVTISGTKEFKMLWDDCKIIVTYENNALEVQNSCAPEEKQKYENIDKVFYDVDKGCEIPGDNDYEALELFTFKDNKIYIISPGNKGFRIDEIDNKRNYDLIYSANEYTIAPCRIYNLKFGQTAVGTFYYLGNSQMKDYHNGDEYINVGYWYYFGDKEYVKANREFKLGDAEGKAKVIIYRDTDKMNIIGAIDENNYINNKKVKNIIIKTADSYDDSNIKLEFEDGSYKDLEMDAEIMY